MADEFYVNLSTTNAINVNGTAGADVAMDVQGLANGSAYTSAVKDWGAPPRPFMYHWSCKVQFQANPTQYTGIGIFVSEAPDDASGQESGDPGSNATCDIDSTYNMMQIGAVTAEEADTTEMTASGYFTSYARYHKYVVANNSGIALNSTDSNFNLLIQPVYTQYQSA